VSSRSSDFNYKVALAQGLKSLQGGRLRQAEEQFRYLVSHFASADGGYRGLAKVFVEQEDRPAALRVLLDGGAALAKADQRAAAIVLYREAVALDPLDLSAHRRLAAALTLVGDPHEVAGEYSRYVKAAIAARELERARQEAAYALERMPDSAEIAALVRDANDTDVSPFPVTASEDPPIDHSIESTPSAASAPDVASAPTAPIATSATEASKVIPEPATSIAGPAVEPISPEGDALSVEVAGSLFAKGDPRVAQHTLEAARRYIAEGRVDAASDLLLQLISSGAGDHEAQRLLVDVARNLGRRDVAKAKVQLLVEALRLDGRTELAAEVEQLARAFS
jgi:tetratricopeptide (TPR) repeat protein